MVICLYEYLILLIRVLRTNNSKETGCNIENHPPPICVNRTTNKGDNEVAKAHHHYDMLAVEGTAAGASEALRLNQSVIIQIGVVTHP